MGSETCGVVRERQQRLGREGGEGSWEEINRLGAVATWPTVKLLPWMLELTFTLVRGQGRATSGAPKWVKRVPAAARAKCIKR